MPERVLVIDENLNPRLARELRNRGRNARAIEEMGLKGADDPDLIRRTFAFYNDPVLVTSDDFMPAEHSAVLNDVQATVATIRPWTGTDDDDYWDGKFHRDPSEWEGEIVHRWAHIIQRQRTGTIRRYGLTSNAAWRLPRRSTRARSTTRR